MKIRDLRSKGNENFSKKIFENGEKSGGAPDGLTDAVNRYNKMDEASLLSEMRRLATENRAKGTLTNEGLDNFLGKASAFMGPEQFKKMQSLVSELKK